MGERIAPELVYRAEDFIGVVRIHKGAGAVVERLACDRGIVGVEDAVDESDEHPARGEPGQRFDNSVEQGAVRVFRVTRRRIMSRDGIVRENTQLVDVTAGSKILKR